MALAESESYHNEKKNVEHTTNRNDKKDKPLTKIIIRRLPPGITQEAFLNQVSPVPEYNYIYTVKGDQSLGENSFSRVYINFSDPEDVYAFKEKFDNYVFVDTKGHEYPAVVEYASFLKVPKKRGKQRQDPKAGTIESEPAYIEFLESLKNQPTLEEKPEYSYQPNTETKNENSTPLLDYVKQRRVDRQRIREEKREERKKKDLERKKYKDEEKKKHFEEKSPIKSYSKSATASTSKSDETKEKSTENKVESDSKLTDKSSEKDYEKVPVASLTYRNRKYDERKMPPYQKSKPKYNPRENDYYERRDTYKPKYDKEKEYKKKVYDDVKKDTTKLVPKKIKKYSERREEMKAKQTTSKAVETPEVEPEKREPSKQVDAKEEETNKTKYSRQESTDNNSDERQDDYLSDSKYKDKENDPRMQRRIRNKDRPTMAIYQPGMLRKKHDEPETKEVKE